MDNKICDERHKRIDEILAIQGKQIEHIDERVRIIEASTSRLEERIEGLIQQLEQLNVTLKWFIGTVGTALIGFFFYIVQSLLG